MYAVISFSSAEVDNDEPPHEQKKAEHYEALMNITGRPLPAWLARMAVKSSKYCPGALKYRCLGI